MTLLSRRVVMALLALVAGTGTLRAQDIVEVVVVASTDAHGRVYHWDYLRDTDYFTPSWQIVPQEAADAVRAVFARREEPPE